MKKLLFVAVLASCASVMATVSQFTTRGGANVQFIDPVVRSEQAAPPAPTVRSARPRPTVRSGQQGPIEFKVHGGGNVQMSERFTTAAQPQG